MKEFEDLLQEGRLAEAEELLLTLDQADDIVLYSWGRLYSRKGEEAKAISYYAKALEINPNNEEARVRLEIAREIFSFRDPNLYNH
ncbi:MAG: tetratricopeptide repeat protein [Tenuifilum sp.]|uniref:tetratricopeptide repeat protein n=1 Tax=Tenuifilum TaxID=2760873 RepID=UPI001B62DCD6|nr:tetratricopeptide repeat protein [Bacteroidales bacterium]HOK86008.1 tetratricopeptide repeat protein [Tenuifilum sp.]MBP9028346.1 tetratricopeptide repeat protein [Bacteroidales bacterium]HON70195.1 tetratricopeptide repeat protein [Tenuifilum sp.]HOU75059.1 tetratricopeptide repeat protein [Tenuifilum sp.]